MEKVNLIMKTDVIEKASPESPKEMSVEQSMESMSIENYRPRFEKEITAPAAADAIPPVAPPPQRMSLVFNNNEFSYDLNTPKPPLTRPFGAAGDSKIKPPFTLICSALDEFYGHLRPSDSDLLSGITVPDVGTPSSVQALVHLLDRSSLYYSPSLLLSHTLPPPSQRSQVRRAGCRPLCVFRDTLSSRRSVRRIQGVGGLTHLEGENNFMSFSYKYSMAGSWGDCDRQSRAGFTMCDR